jgi:hypothetical protein
VMQENHYFGVLPYAPGAIYHAGPCKESDHRCVDGLSCTLRSNLAERRIHLHQLEPGSRWQHGVPVPRHQLLSRAGP